MVHIQNIEHILINGITHKNSINSNPNFVSIGDLSLIDTRSNRQVIVDNGDLGAANLNTITLGDFIPFYFGLKMPMLYVIENGGNFVKRATLAENIVYVVCSVTKIIDNGNTFYFSDGHATDNLTTFFDSSKIDKLQNIIDWEAIKAPYWSGAENLNLKRKKQAEFLILNDVPADTIIGFGCYNNTAKEILVNLGVAENRIKVIPKAYYN